MKKSSSTTVDAYIEEQPQAAQLALKRLRATVKKLAPEAEESIAYQMPAYKYRGKPLIYFGAFKAHISIFPTKSPVAMYQQELAAYQTSKGTIQFAFDHHFPDDLLQKIIILRLDDIERITEKQRTQ
jgi:uncharacterized protein YdhG (YjbR/CyaY superfamily)